MTATPGGTGGDRGKRGPTRSERLRTTTAIQMDPETYEKVLGQTVGHEDFDADATVEIAEHNTSREHRAQAKSEEIETILVRTAEDSAFGAKGLDFQTAGLLEKRLLHTSNLSAGDFHDLDEGSAEGGLNERAIPGRYDVVDILGEGASGQVFAATDNNLGRQVAVKFLHPEDAADGDKMARFVKEAQVTSTLEHPNILPVFDFDLTDGGLAYFTMRKAAGSTLFDAIKRSQAAGHAEGAIATFNDRVAIMLKVCDAIAYAHDRGIIHQDIKPSNIMLGEHGAVVLVDWGTALTPEDRALPKVPLMGTPAYMAPEQARRDGVDERSDIYCIGASFFQLLTLRYPTWADDPDSFWEMKRAGIIQGPTEAEARMIPGALLDIALKAMAAEPEARYATVEAMRRDLLNFQEGLSVSAHEDSLGELLRRWYRLNRKAVWVAAAALVLIAALGAFYAYEKAKEQSSWHHYASEGFDFTDAYKLERDWVGLGLPNWRTDQAIPLPGESEAWTLRDGRLEITASADTTDCVNLGYRRALPDDFRVRWSATPLDSGSNVNCFLGNRDRSDAYVFHVGGYGQPESVTLTKGPQLRRIERRFLRRPLQPGRAYRFTLERRGNSVSLAIDGTVVLAYDDPDMAIGPERNSFGFEVAQNRVAIDAVEIEYLPLAQKIDPIAVADSFYARQHYQEASEHYARIRELYPNTAMATRAAYRIGRCLAGEGRIEEAIASLSLFAVEHPEHPLSHQARFDIALLAMDSDQLELAADSLGELADAQPAPALRRASLLMVEDLIRRQRGLGRDGLLLRPREEAIAELSAGLDELDGWTERLGIAAGDPSGDDNNLRRTIADQLSRLGAHELILERFADDPARVFGALVAMGRSDEAIARFPNQHKRIAAVLQNQGRFDELLERYPDSASAWSVLVDLKRYDEALERWPERERSIRIKRLMDERRYEEALELTNYLSQEWFECMWKLGRYEETRGKAWEWRDWQMDIMLGRPEVVAEDPATITSVHRMMAIEVLLFDAIEAGDQAAIARWRAAFDALPVLERNAPFERLLIPVLIDEFTTRPGALRAAEAELRERYSERFGGAIARTLDQLLEPESEHTAEDTSKTSTLTTAIRHELEGRIEQAIAAYRESMADEEAWRPLSRFATWRIRELDGE